MVDRVGAQRALEGLLEMVDPIPIWPAGLRRRQPRPRLINRPAPVAFQVQLIANHRPQIMKIFNALFFYHALSVLYSVGLCHHYYRQSDPSSFEKRMVEGRWLTIDVSFYLILTGGLLLLNNLKNWLDRAEPIFRRMRDEHEPEVAPVLSAASTIFDRRRTTYDGVVRELISYFPAVIVLTVLNFLGSSVPFSSEPKNMRELPNMLAAGARDVLLLYLASKIRQAVELVNEVSALGVVPEVVDAGPQAAL